MINNLCFNNLELYLDIFVLIQPRRIEIYCNYLMLFTFELYLGFVTFRTLIVSPVIGPFILMFAVKYSYMKQFTNRKRQLNGMLLTHLR
jgi:hypothetical protein